MTKINGYTPEEWCNDESLIVVIEYPDRNKDNYPKFGDHRELNEETEELEPTWPPNAEEYGKVVKE